MNETTIKRLNQLNRQFYQITGAEFDQSRGRPWPGWERLLPYLPQSPVHPLRVLDVGCGNGRFGRFLWDRLGGALEYHGIDSSQTLLASAQRALDDVPGMTLTLTHQDVLDQPLPAATYDLVVLFGVLHHVPGAVRRRVFLRDLAERVVSEGLLVFSAWRFYDYERFRARIVPWPAELDVEPGDYLLDWRRGARAVRYCHFVDDAEHAALLTAAGLVAVDDYRADGRSGATNRYSILRRAVHNPSPSTDE